MTKTIVNPHLLCRADASHKEEGACNFKKYGSARFRRQSHVLIFLKESYFTKGHLDPKEVLYRKRLCTNLERESAGYMLDPVLNYSKALKWLIHLSWVEHWAVTKKPVTFICNVASIY